MADQVSDWCSVKVVRRFLFKCMWGVVVVDVLARGVFFFYRLG